MKPKHSSKFETYFSQVPMQNSFGNTILQPGICKLERLSHALFIAGMKQGFFTNKLSLVDLRENIKYCREIAAEMIADFDEYVSDQSKHVQDVEIIK